MPRHQVLPVNGTREALFAFVQAVVDRGRTAPLVLMPNPCYQIYEGAALLAGAEPYYLDTTAATATCRISMRCPTDVWRRCQLLFLCSPGQSRRRDHGSSPTSTRALELAERHDFVIASDECYADLFDDESAPPPSLLTAACAHAATTAFERCMVFHSLSKRSSLPGLRSGFVAGSAGAHRAVPAVPHLPRLRDAGADAARQHRRRGTTTRTSPRTARCTARSTPACCRSSPRRCRWRSPRAASTSGSHVPGDDDAFTAGLFAAAERHGGAGKLSRARRAAAAIRAPGRDPHLARSPTSRNASSPRAASATMRGCAGHERHPEAARSRARGNAARNINPGNVDASTRRAVEDAIGQLDSGAAPHRRARRRERRVDGQRLAEEGRAAVLPRERQPAHRRRPHALLRQGAAEVRRPGRGAAQGGRRARRAAGGRAPRRLRRAERRADALAT